MLEPFKVLIAHQFEAALSVLKACVDACPETAWNAPVATYRFSQVVFHTLYFTDLYLGRDDEASFRRQPFHRELAPLFADLPVKVEPFENAAPRSYDRALLLTYLELCRRKVGAALATETEESLRAPDGFGGKFSRAERHVNNIRHINHHAAQLSLRLRLHSGIEVEWVASGWHEAASLPAGSG